MPSLNPLSWWRRFLALPNDRPVKALGMALLVSLVCSLLVALTAVALKPRRDANRLAESGAEILSLVDLLGVGVPDRLLVDLATGEYVTRDPGTSTPLPEDRDLAGLGEREDVATVFEVRAGGILRLVILPVRGVGYQSMLEGYLALEPDLNTVAALTFYEHGETPGLGAGIEEPEWQALWPGKRVADADGVIRLEVVEGAGEGVHEVDGISGATFTMSGVTQLVRFWLGPDGYGPYLARRRTEAGR